MNRSALERIVTSALATQRHAEPPNHRSVGPWVLVNVRDFSDALNAVLERALHEDAAQIAEAQRKQGWPQW